MAETLAVTGTGIPPCRCAWWEGPCAEEIAVVAGLDAAELARLNSLVLAELDPECPERRQSGPVVPEEDDDGAPLRPLSPELRAVVRENQDRADLVETLSAMAPGPALARFLDQLDRAALNEYELVEVVAAYRRLEAWSAAEVAATAAELAERPALNPHWPVDSHGRLVKECVAGDELAPRLGMSRSAARQIVTSGRAFRGAFTQTGEALRTGAIDSRKADIIVTTLIRHPGPVAWAVEQEVLPGAGLRTHAQLVRDLAKALLTVDPDEADARHIAARRERRVNHPRPLPDGMASIYAVLPAGDAVGLDLALEAAARAAKNAGDTRTLDQLRADTLSLMGAAALELGYVGPPPPDAAPRRPVRERDDARRPPAAPDGGAACPGLAEPDEAQAGLPSRTGPPGSGSPELGDDTGTGASESLPPHRGAALPRMRLGMIGGGRTQVRVTVPLAVALPPPPGPSPADAGWGADDSGGARVAGEVDVDAAGQVAEVAELEGYGPVCPEVARALMLGGTWQRLVTDPSSGAVLDVGRTRYQPPSDLATYVRERDRTCVRPGCSTDARACDLDHTTPWSQDGRTAADNLAALCPRDHTIKTLGAFSVRHLPGGAYEWTTPTGHAYRRSADGTVTLLPPRAATALRERAALPPDPWPTRAWAPGATPARGATPAAPRVPARPDVVSEADDGAPWDHRVPWDDDEPPF
ncbi:HNH endonuclease signature motif containing protein [Georgenia faecalis]|uniref:HNH endonuclease signature motif containing protein n=1 Tax=Georgenia faecalis TaxID=2483799 RepID=UPI000FDAC259|nr:HNH endonuclease signature motif containing protein [Georgenia faecalis]